MDQLGFETQGVSPNLSLALGTLAMSPLEVAAGYAMIANGGYLIEPYLVARVTDNEGQVLFEADPLTVCRNCDETDTTDQASIDKWDDYTEAKEAMFFYTDTADAPWTIIKSDDKKRARLNCMRHFLSEIPYDTKDHHVVGHPDPLIVGSGEYVIKGGAMPGGPRS